MHMVKIVAYGCSSSAGPSVEDFWRGLLTGQDHSRRHTEHARLCSWKSKGTSFLTALTRELMYAWRETKARLGETRFDDKTGVIFASTKGNIDDFIWSEAAIEKNDSLTPVLNQFLKEANLRPAHSLCVSNACASVPSALYLARQWIQCGRLNSVLILAADVAGPFVTRGFEALKTLTPGRARPFDRDRQGFYLGDAACALFVTRTGAAAPGVTVEGIGLDAEGFAVTRPSTSGESLRRACLQLGSAPPDLIVAHGTATVANDATEDRVFSELYSAPLTSTKWSIGHTLGASGGMDMIAACEVLRNRRSFAMGNTLEVDPAFRGRYLIGTDTQAFAGQRVLVSSLGFGGIHGAVLLRGPS